MKSETDSKREMQIAWPDPQPSFDAASKMSGVEWLSAIAAGELPGPPIAHLTGAFLKEVEKGRAVFELITGEQHYNPMLTVHGGVYSLLADSATGCAVHSMLEQGEGYTTAELHVNMIRPADKNTGRLRCVAEVVHMGRKLAVAQADIYDDDDRLYAHASATCMIFRPSK